MAWIAAGNTLTGGLVAEQRSNQSRGVASNSFHLDPCRNREPTAYAAGLNLDRIMNAWSLTTSETSTRLWHTQTKQNPHQKHSIARLHERGVQRNQPSV